jgi:hypothetical protein
MHWDGASWTVFGSDYRAERIDGCLPAARGVAWCVVQVLIEGSLSPARVEARRYDRTDGSATAVTVWTQPNEPEHAAYADFRALAADDGTLYLLDRSAAKQRMVRVEGQVVQDVPPPEGLYIEIDPRMAAAGSGDLWVPTVDAATESLPFLLAHWDGASWRSFVIPDSQYSIGVAATLSIGPGKAAVYLYTAPGATRAEFDARTGATRVTRRSLVSTAENASDLSPPIGWALDGGGGLTAMIRVHLHQDCPIWCPDTRDKEGWDLAWDGENTLREVRQDPWWGEDEAPGPPLLDGSLVRPLPAPVTSGPAFEVWRLLPADGS